MLYLLKTLYETETNVNVESPEDEPDDGDVLDEVVEDDVHTDEGDHNI